jgi:phage/plasmid-like protein (TIGR03299 family)
MAHEIDMSNNRANVFVTGEAAWHRLGVNVSQAQSSDEAIKLAGLDWDVIQLGVQAVNAVGDGTIEIPGHYANVRSDTKAPLAVVSEWYRPFQNREAFDFMDSIVGEKLAMFETAGSLKGGRTVWMLARIPKDLRAGGDDVTHPYILLTNTHDGTRALRMIPTAIRVVCWNTLTLALSTSCRTEGIAIPHFDNLEQRVKEARDRLGIIVRRLDQYETEMVALKSRKLVREELATYFADVAFKAAESEKGRKKILENLAECMEHPTNTVDGMQGTAWGAYNTVSLYADHRKKVLGTGARGDDNRLSSIWFGAANTMKQDAYKRALSLVS